MPDTAFFNGLKFTKQSTGYLGAHINGKLVLMHRYVWEFYNGEIPKGYIVHHKDKDKTNNDLDNLECLPNREHSTMHGKNKTPEQHRRDVETLAKAREKAVEWHKSEAGRECSRRNAKRLIEQGILNPMTLYTCDNCGKQFLAPKRSAKHKFCSGACEQYFRRHNGLNNETRVCIICGKEFVTDRYGRTKTCSRSCGMKLAHKNNPSNWRNKGEN